MSSRLDARHRLPLHQAARLADKIKRTLALSCVRLEIAGSIRRRQPTIGDIEMLAIPLRQPGLFGQPEQSMLDLTLDQLVRDARLQRGRCEGERYKNFLIPSVEGLALDLFIVTPETWGVQMAIRTGPADFSRRLVTHQSYGGLLPDHLTIEEGRIWMSAGAPLTELPAGVETEADHPGERCPLRTPEERDVFACLTCGWIEPEDRR